MTDSSKAILTFLGIDTISTILLNGQLLGHTDNMFVRYQYDVKDLLKSSAPGGMNTLQVEIENPIKAASNLASNNSFTPPNCPPGVYNGECHMNFLRKMQASFAWDWGLAAPSSGLWKGVELEIYDMASIRDATVDMELMDKKWNVRFRVYLETGVSSAKVKGDLEILIAGLSDGRVAEQIDNQSDERGELAVDLEVVVSENDVKLWWPNGFGEQMLYSVNISFAQQDKALGLFEEIDTKTLRIGFRTINLIQEPLGE